MFCVIFPVRNGILFHSYDYHSSPYSTALDRTNLAINLHIPGTVGSSLRPNFVRQFRAISEQVSLFWKYIYWKFQTLLKRKSLVSQAWNK